MLAILIALASPALAEAPDGTTCLGAEGIMFQAIPTGEPL